MMKNTGKPDDRKGQVRFDVAGAGNGFTVELVRHRQTKETEQIGFTYGTPRQSSTLPNYRPCTRTCVGHDKTTTFYICNSLTDPHCSKSCTEYSRAHFARRDGLHDRRVGFENCKEPVELPPERRAESVSRNPPTRLECPSLLTCRSSVRYRGSMPSSSDRRRNSHGSTGRGSPSIPAN